MPCICVCVRVCECLHSSMCVHSTCVCVRVCLDCLKRLQVKRTRHLAHGRCKNFSCKNGKNVRAQIKFYTQKHRHTHINMHVYMYICKHFQVVENLSFSKRTRRVYVMRGFKQATQQRRRQFKSASMRY